MYSSILFLNKLSIVHTGFSINEADFCRDRLVGEKFCSFSRVSILIGYMLTKCNFICLFQEGREGREKYGYRQKKTEFASRTNKEKRKTKAFSMIKHKVKRKQKRSFREKQIALRDALLKQRKKK